MTDQAQHAIHAAKHVKAWGRRAAMTYCERRGIPLRLFTLARQLEAMQ